MMPAMKSRMVLWTIALAACEFRHGIAPIDAPADAPAEAAPMDAPGCTAVEVRAGGEHTCALTLDGSLYCWGRGDEGQIGIDPASRCNNNTVFCQKRPAKIDIGVAHAVGLGAAHTCAATEAQAYCWGRNATGQFGNGSVIGATKPTPISERAGATTFDGGDGHGCSLADGALGCSGMNAQGQVGNMSVVQQPTVVTVLTGVTAFDLDSSTSCAIDTARQLQCWGRNMFRTIDPESTTIKTAPTVVPGISAVDHVAVGADHLCAATGGLAKCWGLNTSGQIGNGHTNNASQPQPITTVTGVVDVVEVAASANHTCARTASGDVYCFGEGYTPVPTRIVSGATQIAAGTSHDCAIVEGTVRCWGDQRYGQLGNDVDSASRTVTPQLAQICP